MAAAHPRGGALTSAGLGGGRVEDDGWVQRTAGGAGGPRAGRLTGPVDLALARASETIPQRLGGGGLLFSLKWDGYLY